MTAKPDIAQLERDLGAAVLDVLARYCPPELPPLEFDGELRGLIRHRGDPTTETGWGFRVGAGLPASWAAADRDRMAAALPDRPHRRAKVLEMP